MFENFFRQFNAYLLGHPAFLAKLKLLFWIKSWALMLLMGFFLYLIFREQGFRRLEAPPPPRQRGTYCFKA